MKEAPPTMEMVAKVCGVSVMTVSRALDPARMDKVSPETRERILAVVRNCGYHANPAASRLKRRKLDTITLLPGHRASHGGASPDFDLHYETISWGVVRGVVEEARRRNYDVKIEPLYDSGLDEIMPRLSPTLTEGVIFSSSYMHEPAIRHVRGLKMPHAIMEWSASRSAPAGSSRDASRGGRLLIDRFPGYAGALEHLLSKGHRKIGFMGCELQSSSREQRSFYMKELKGRGLFDKSVFFSVSTAPQLRSLLLGLSRPLPFTALLCYNDSCADIAIKELRYAGVEVPGEVAVVGFDRNLAYQGEGRSNLSSIRMPLVELASEAAKSLIEGIAGDSPIDGLLKVLPATFVAGETT